MFVSTGTSTLLALLLLIATLQPYNLLPTEQSSRVQSPLYASNLAINTSANHTLNSLLARSHNSRLCLDFIDNDESARTEGKRCRAYQQPWLNLILEKGVHLVDPEYTCKDDYLNAYCNVLVARAYCKEDYFDEFRKEVQHVLVDMIQECSPWISWQPPMESPPLITEKIVECEDTFNEMGTQEKCAKKVKETIAKWNITDLTELWCNKTYELEKCTIWQACKYCGKSANSTNKFLDYVGSIWSPKAVECTQWASEEPKMDCSATEAPTKSPITSPVSSTSVSSALVQSTTVPSVTINPLLSACMLLLLKNGQLAHCQDKAAAKYPNPTEHNVKTKCIASYYAIGCGLKAACKYCSTDAKDLVIDEAQKDVAGIREQCELWSSDEPKLECSTNALLIVGIIIGVIVILAVIGVMVYCMCWHSSSGGRSIIPALPTQAKQVPPSKRNIQAVPALQTQTNQDSLTERSSNVVPTFPPTLIKQVPRSYGSTRLVRALPTQANQDPQLERDSRAVLAHPTQANQDSPTERSSKVVPTFPPTLINQVPRSYGSTRLVSALPTFRNQDPQLKRSN